MLSVVQHSPAHQRQNTKLTFSTTTTTTTTTTATGPQQAPFVLKQFHVYMYLSSLKHLSTFIRTISVLPETSTELLVVLRFPSFPSCISFVLIADIVAKSSKELPVVISASRMK